MSILCEFGFHKWSEWSNVTKGVYLKMYQERTCLRCNYTQRIFLDNY